MGPLQEEEETRKFNKTKYTHSPQTADHTVFQRKAKRTTVLIRRNRVLNLRGTMRKVIAVIWVGVFSLAKAAVI